MKFFSKAVCFFASSLKFVKIKYNDENPKPLEVKGLNKKPIFCDLEEFKELIPNLVQHEIKFFINAAKDRNFDEFIHELKNKKENFTIIDNQSISLMIETSMIEDKKYRQSTKQIITENILNSRPDLEPTLLEIFQEVEQLTDAI